MTRPVRWVETMDYLREKGLTTFLQTSNRTLFQNMDSELRDVLCWGSLEQWINGDLYDFDKLFHQGNSPLFSAGFLNDCLRKMIADPWSIKTTFDGTDVEQARNGYLTVQNLWNERGNEPTREDVCLAIKKLNMVLTLKKINPKIISWQIQCLLEKYAIEEMFDGYAII